MRISDWSSDVCSSDLLTISMPGCALIALPTVGPSPCTRLNTPAGTPAASRISAKLPALPGHSSEGLRIIVLPAASAGATLRAIWFSAQFPGAIMPTTPIDSYAIGRASDRDRVCPDGVVTVGDV